MDALEHRCWFCDKVLKGRADKKFCDDNCKNAYHNAQKITEHKEIKKIDLTLKKNRRILKGFFDPKRENKLIGRYVLVKAGFDFDFHTHVVVTKIKENKFVFCYDYGYREVEKDKFKLIKSFK